MTRSYVYRLSCARSLPAFALLSGMVSHVIAQVPLGTEFSYQGNLSSPGMPAVSNADFQFTLFDALDGGVQIGAILPKNNVALVNGVFTVSLDFGAPAYTGNARWLQVAVRSPAGTGGFTPLAPRQALSPTPHATYSTQTRGITVDGSGRVGVGVTPVSNPNAKMQVAGSVAVQNGAGFLGLNSTGNGVAYGLRWDSGDDLTLHAGGSEKIRVNADGRVGIGEFLPAHKLHVTNHSTASTPAVGIEGNGQAFMRFYPQGQGNILTTGDIGFPQFDEPILYIRNFDPAAKVAFTGAEGTRFPATGKEDLRIIRGFVIGDGTVDYGTGFTVNRIEEGRYVINFDTPFTEFPVATANTVSVGFSSCFIEFSGIGPASIGLHVVRRSDGDLVDGHFYFIAIGPR